MSTEKQAVVDVVDGGLTPPETLDTHASGYDDSSSGKVQVLLEPSAGTDGGPMTPEISVTTCTSENTSDGGGSHNQRVQSLLVQDPAVMPAGTDGGPLTPEISITSENISDTGSKGGKALKAQTPLVMDAGIDVTPEVTVTTRTSENISNTGDSYQQQDAATRTDSELMTHKSISVKRNEGGSSLISLRKRSRLHSEKKKSRYVVRTFKRNFKGKSDSGRSLAEEELELLSDTPPRSITDYDSASSTTQLSSDQDVDIALPLRPRQREQGHRQALDNIRERSASRDGSIREHDVVTGRRQNNEGIIGHHAQPIRQMGLNVDGQVSDNIGEAQAMSGNRDGSIRGHDVVTGRRQNNEGAIECVAHHVQPIRQMGLNIDGRVPDNIGEAQAMGGHRDGIIRQHNMHGELPERGQDNGVAAARVEAANNPIVRNEGDHPQNGAPHNDDNNNGVAREDQPVQSCIAKCIASRKHWVTCRITYAIIISLLLSMMVTALGLIFYCVAEVIQTNKSGLTVWMSTSEVYSLNATESYNKMSLYTSQVCIDQIDRNLEHINVFLESGSCSDVLSAPKMRVIQHSFSFMEEARNLNFYWLKGTTFSFNLNITSPSLELGNFTIYVFHYDRYDPSDECANGVPPDRVAAMFTFFYPENIHTYNITCTRDSTTDVSTCSTSQIVINETGRYLMCIISNFATSVLIDYELHINEFRYVNTSKFVSETCHLDEGTNCCMSFKDILKEVRNPTCMLIRTTVTGESDNAYSLPRRFHIMTQQKWDSVEYLVYLFIVPTVVFVSVVSLCSYTCYRKRHPEGYCLKLSVNDVTCVC